MVNATYTTIERIWQRHIGGEAVDIESEIRILFAQRELKMRQDDGQLKQINISIPTSLEDAFVVGLRYVKRNGACTEDLFLCPKNLAAGITRLEIEPFYKGRLEFILPEYNGTHHQQVIFTQPVAKDGHITSVNTITFLKDN